MELSKTTMLTRLNRTNHHFNARGASGSSRPPRHLLTKLFDLLCTGGIIAVCFVKGELMNRKFVRAIFPGSFDPITNGHLDVIDRGIKLFDELIIAVGRSPIKNQLFTPEERVEMISELIEQRNMTGVLVESFEGLTVEYAAGKKADVILRGLRSLTDVQYEFQLAMTNRAVAGIETIFIMTSEQYGFTSSTLIREIASLGGDLSNLIPKNIQDRLKQKIAARGT
jgi:pantetheine-phosphate adenylyltransferase